MNAPRLWSHEETATYLGIPPATLHQWNSRGYVGNDPNDSAPPSYKVGKYRRYRPAEIEAWLDNRVCDHGDDDRGHSAGRRAS